MFRKLFFCALSLILISNIKLFAQVESDSTREYRQNNFWYDWDNSEWSDWGFHGKPFIEVNYGFGIPKHDKLVSKIADVGAAEIKLGYATQDAGYYDNLIDFHDKYAFFSKLSSELKSTSSKLGEMKSDLWRFGLGNRSGYGYRLGGFSILPYHGGGFVWSKLDMKEYPAQFYTLLNPPMELSDARNDTDILNRFHDSFRFGTFSEGGVRFEVASFVSMDICYEAEVIFPRYLFWKHAGSLLIEEGTMGVLNHFIDKISDSSPYAAPIVNFFLKNGLSYAFYSLKKTNMNWPFSTESPLTYETIKFGLTFTF
jgi:hypothetical protein